MNQTGSIWAEVDLSAIRHNFRQLKGLTGPRTRVMGVVKADAYGHGAVAVARTLASEGADWFGVARHDEAVALRRAGLDEPILVFGHIPPERLAETVGLNITQTVGSWAQAKALDEAARDLGVRVRVHMKIDTGMGRMGFLPAQHHGDTPLPEVTHRLLGLPGLALEGAYTHFASADGTDLSRARRQLNLFRSALNEIERAGFTFPLVHAANSAATIALPEAHFDMIRPGISMYGLAPSPEMDISVLDLRPALAIKTALSMVRTVGEGFSVSYGHTWTTPGPASLAVVPIGYGDGYDRGLSSRGTMLVHGTPVPVVGRVCMDQTMIDVTGIAGVAPGDEAVVLGAQNGAAVTADDIAATLGTINYEVVTRLMARVPRRYADTGGMPPAPDNANEAPATHAP